MMTEEQVKKWVERQNKGAEKDVDRFVRQQANKKYTFWKITMTIPHALVFIFMSMNLQTGQTAWTMNQNTPLFKSLVDCQNAKKEAERHLSQPHIKIRVQKYGLECIRIDRELM